MGILISPNRAMFNAPQAHTIHAERAARCIICGLWGEYVRGSWLIDTYVENDGQGDFIDGSELTEARETDYGFCCSDVCCSQAMYQHAEPHEKESLDKMLDALRAIQEEYITVRKLADKWMPNIHISECLVAEAHINEKSLLGDGEPSWSNR